MMAADRSCCRLILNHGSFQAGFSTRFDSGTSGRVPKPASFSLLGLGLAGLGGAALAAAEGVLTSTLATQRMMRAVA
jgi:hypothetical protein